MTETAPPRVGAREIRRVLRENPGFTRLYAAQLVSFGGDWFATVALQGLVLQTTGRPTMAGLMLATQLLPTALVGPFAGAVVDRVDRRFAMVAADIGRALLALGLLFATSTDTLWIAFVCVGVMSALAGFFDPASSAALPNLVAPRDLAMANVLMGSAWGVMLTVGAGIGGVVSATLGREAAYIGDAASFVISAALLLSIRGRFQVETRARDGVSVADDVVEMIRFARRERRVGSLLLVKGGFGLAAGVITLISVLAVETFRSGETGIGIIMSARGLGALIGPFVFRRMFGDSDRALFVGIAFAFVLFGIGYALFGVSPTLWVAALGAFVAHVGGGAQWTFSSIGLQRFTPDRIRGRVFGADYSLVSLSIAISLAATGVLADHLGPRVVALGLSALAVLWAVAWTVLTRSSWPDAESRAADRPATPAAGPG